MLLKIKATLKIKREVALTCALRGQERYEKVEYPLRESRSRASSLKQAHPTKPHTFPSIYHIPSPPGLEMAWNEGSQRDSDNHNHLELSTPTASSWRNPLIPSPVVEVERMPQQGYHSATPFLTLINSFSKSMFTFDSGLTRSNAFATPERRFHSLQWNLTQNQPLRTPDLSQRSNALPIARLILNILHEPHGSPLHQWVFDIDLHHVRFSPTNIFGSYGPTLGLGFVGEE